MGLQTGELFDESMRGNIIPNIPVDIATWQQYTEANAKEINLNGGMLSYFFMKNILKEVNLTQFYLRARKDFKGYTGVLPNEAIVCKMNEVSHKNLMPLFEKNGFKLEPCSDKTYDFLKEDRNNKIIYYGIDAALISMVLYLPMRFLYRHFKKKI